MAGPLDWLQQMLGGTMGEMPRAAPNTGAIDSLLAAIPPSAFSQTQQYDDATRQLIDQGRYADATRQGLDNPMLGAWGGNIKAAGGPIRPYRLEPAKPDDVGYPYGGLGEGGKVYRIEGPEGPTGIVQARVQGDSAIIDDIFDISGGRNALGPSVIRSLLGQLKADNPGVRRITGERVSGARFGGETVERGAGADVAVDLPAPQRGARWSGPPIRAYHGSPHEFPAEPGYPLGRFDIGKIGTGEGNQTYLRGLYFGEAEGTGARYREMLAGQPTFSLIGPDGRPIITGAHSAARFAPDMGERLRSVMPTEMPFVGDSIARLWGEGRPLDVSSVINEAWGGLELPAAIRPKIETAVKDAIERAKPTLDQFRVETVRPGHTYEVDIHAAPEQFLHGDRSFADQPAPVRRALEEIGVPESVMSRNAGETLARAGRDPFTAADVFNRGGEPLPLTAEDVATRLREAGIPGNRYLDAFSRPADKGTHNLAVWDDSIIEIMRKYGILPPLAAGGLLGGGPDDDAAY